MMKIFKVAIALFGLVFGWACLNYTSAFNHENHVEFADQNSLPAPSPLIYWIGVAILAGSSFFIGTMLSNWRRVN